VQLRRSQHIRPRLWDTVNFDVDRTEAVAQAANAQRLRLRANRPRDRDHLRLARQNQRREAHDCVPVLLGHGLATNDGVDGGDDAKAIGFPVREGRPIVTEVGVVTLPSCGTALPDSAAFAVPTTPVMRAIASANLEVWLLTTVIFSSDCFVAKVSKRRRPVTCSLTRATTERGIFPVNSSTVDVGSAKMPSQDGPPADVRR
jgi:hypothetical protein